MRKAVVLAAFVVVVAAVAGGVYLVGPPAEARARRLDARRQTDLQGLRMAVDLYWTRSGRLPESLDELTHEAGRNIDSRDPETGEPYGYTVRAADRYELCAGFARDSEMRSDFWSHGAGRRCFQIAAKAVRP
jgi:hypothetical protein